MIIDRIISTSEFSQTSLRLYASLHGGEAELGVVKDLRVPALRCVNGVLLGHGLHRAANGHGDGHDGAIVAERAPLVVLDLDHHHVAHLHEQARH